MRPAPAGGGLLALAVALLLSAALPLAGSARAAVRVDASVDIEAEIDDPDPAFHAEPVARGGRLSVDVWTNKEEGGVYRPGERMRIYFRPSDDAFVLIYNIDTEGYIHLIYPYAPDDPDRLEGGRTYQVPSRGDPYDLAADGPPGIEYVVALASPFPFRDLPWYLSAGYDGPPSDDQGYEEAGVIAGDPYVGMDRVIRRIVPPGREDEVATADTYFYIERRVPYPRYVCADCHSYGGWYDPYVDHCSVVHIRIDATWARYTRARIVRPRYFYLVRSTAPTRYRQWKQRWSSVDGRSNLRQRFETDGQDKFRRREFIQRRTPPEFRDRRLAPERRPLRGNDEVIRQRDRADEARERQVRDRRDLRLRERRERDSRDPNLNQRDPRGRGRMEQELRDRRESRERVMRERAVQRHDERSRRMEAQERARRERVEPRQERGRDRERAESREDRGRSRERAESREDRGRSRERAEAREDRGGGRSESRERRGGGENRGNGRGNRDRDR